MPEWFIDATDILTTLLDDRARAHQIYLLSLCPAAKKAFWLCQRLVKKAVDKAKEAWINKVNGDAEHSRDGKLRWECI